MSNSENQAARVVVISDERVMPTIIAALRLMQRGRVPAEIAEIASDGGEIEPLDDFEIDELIQNQLNVDLPIVFATEGAPCALCAKV